MKVIELAELLSGCSLPLCPNPGRANQSKVGAHCAGWYRGRGQTKCPLTAGLGYTKKKSALARVAHFF